MSTPLLVARSARISVDDAVAIPQLDLATTGDRLVVAGNAGPLVAALGGIAMGASQAARAAADGELVAIGGRARVTGGSLLLRGRDVGAGEQLARVGAVPFDPPLPQTWSVEAYILESTRLASTWHDAPPSRVEIERRVGHAIERTGLTRLRRSAIRSLHEAERRVVAIAAVLGGDPEVIVADRPLANLDGQPAQFVFGALQAASHERGLVASVAHLRPGTIEGTLARSATDLAAFVGAELSMFGRPAELLLKQKVYRVTVRSNADALREALAAKGASLDGGPTRFTLTLAEGQDPSFVLGVASEVRSAVVEILPVV